MSSTGVAVVVSFAGAGADATTGSAVVVVAGLGAAAAVAVRGAAAAGFGEANGSEFTKRFRSLCALRATSQPDSRSKNPTPRVCLNRLFFSLTTYAPFKERYARTDERSLTHGGCRWACHAVNSPHMRQRGRRLSPSLSSLLHCGKGGSCKVGSVTEMPPRSQEPE